MHTYWSKKAARRIRQYIRIHPTGDIVLDPDVRLGRHGPGGAKWRPAAISIDRSPRRLYHQNYCTRSTYELQPLDVTGKVKPECWLYETRCDAARPATTPTGLSTSSAAPAPEKYRCLTA